MSKKYITTVPIIIKLIICISLAVADANHNNHYGFGIPHTTTSRGFAFFSPRGGGNSDSDNESKIDTIIESPSDGRQQLIGVIDLRPELEPDSIILAQESNADGNDETADSTLENIVQQGQFPTTDTNQDEILTEIEIEEMQDQQAASSHSIGSLCHTVYLIVAYDFDNGKTVLNGSFGGTKLMAFIDGVRSRWHGVMKSQEEGTGQSNGESDASTKLVVFLVPSSPSSSVANTLLSDGITSSTTTENISVYSLTDDDENANQLDASGAKYLVNRLSEAFAYGGEDYKKVEKPFIVEMLGVIKNAGQEKECEADDGNGSDKKYEMNEVLLRHVKCTVTKANSSVGTPKSTAAAANSIQEFQDLIKQVYDSAGGSGHNLNFQ